MDILNLKIIEEWLNVYRAYEEFVYIELCYFEVICVGCRWVFKEVYK